MAQNNLETKVEKILESEKEVCYRVSKGMPIERYRQAILFEIEGKIQELIDQVKLPYNVFDERGNPYHKLVLFEKKP
jgi:hypothetical protein